MSKPFTYALLLAAMLGLAKAGIARLTELQKATVA